MVVYKAFTHVLEDATRLTMLPMFRELNVIGLVLEKEDEVKMRYPTSAITASRTSSKFIYAT